MNEHSASTTSPATRDPLATPGQAGAHGPLAKVPAVTLGFWIIKIAATTLGETAGDMVTMSMNLGYLAGTAIFAAVTVVVVMAQIRTARFHPVLYWIVIVATTTVGTTLADLVTRSLGIGYLGGSLLLATLVLISLLLWYRTLGTVSVESVTSPRAEAFYWGTILFSQTLGTALGDWLADDGGLGYAGGALVFGAMLAAIAATYAWTNVSRTLLFWSAFVLTRPLGATIGDFLDKPVASGGLEMSRYVASAVLALFIAVCIALIRQPGEKQPT